MDELLRSLVAYQEEQGLSNVEMAVELGIDPSTWSRIRHGRRGIGPDVLRRILRRFPELGPLFLLTTVRADGTTIRAVRHERESTNVR
jgi:plasmid maintenance system antidote protein VapI